MVYHNGKIEPAVVLGHGAGRFIRTGGVVSGKGDGMAVTMDVAVVELLCSRLCHDLVSPIGAINNGIELIEETGPGDADEALGLIADSADAAAKRLKLFRLAFGAAGAQETLTPADARAVLEGWFRSGRVALNWGATSPQPPARGQLKLVMLAALLLEEALPRGGSIRVQDAKGGFLLLGEGSGAAFRPEVRVALADQPGAEELTARAVVSHFTARLATHYSLSVSLHEDGQGHVSVRIG